MDIKEVRTHLGRVKAYHQRKETERALASIIMAIKGMGNKPFPSDLRSLLREVVQLIGRDDVITDVLGKPLVYQPGQEQAILAGVAKVYKVLQGQAGVEDHKQALDRKLNIDRTLNQGMKLLEQGKVPEADECFSQAVSHYKDEHSLFTMIGKALMEANQVRRALPYLKRAATITPQNENVKELVAKCMELRSQL